VGVPEPLEHQRVFGKESPSCCFGPKFSALVVVLCKSVEEVGFGLLADPITLV